ncbi:hypothetical protein RJ55_05715 [Drechmeria coniospora]|nr:hypothetical protein RJ55_05715 [Drechmeria coniospora]
MYNYIVSAAVLAQVAAAAGINCTTGNCLQAPGTKLNLSTTATINSSDNPCAQVSSAWASQKKTKPTEPPSVPAALAHECLNSIPVGKELAINLVDSLEPYLEWHSNTPFLKDPPKDYFYPAYDMFANLASVRANLEADKYASEYAFQKDLLDTVFMPAHDGHFYFYPDAMVKAFLFERARSLVSISEDGQSLPVIKIYEEVIADPKTARTVAKINGIDAAKYVEHTVSKFSDLHDIDAAYNSMFFEKATFAYSGIKGAFSAGSGIASIVYQGPNTTFSFTDGTTLAVENKANIVGDMAGVTDGSSFYLKFCDPFASRRPKKTKSSGTTGKATSNEHTKRATDNRGALVRGYPQPTVSSPDGNVSGYYLAGKGLEDVAVISLLSFKSNDRVRFQASVREFFRQSVAAGKTKLVIDLQGNDGGFSFLGYDFFRQLFPDVEPDGFSRFKNSKGFVAMSRVISDAVKDINPFTSDDVNLVDFSQIAFNYRYDLNVHNKPFRSFEEKFGPHMIRDTPYTSLMRWNLTDPIRTTNASMGAGIQISGYGKLANLSAPFKPENIVLLYDGACASTCTLASEMLRIQGGVKSVAFGGRPREGAIQGVGGTKGAQTLDFENMAVNIYRASQLTKDSKLKAELNRYNILPQLRSGGTGINSRDQLLRDNIEDGVPAQFVRENADCRLYWTAPMITDVGEVWKAAAHAAFNGGRCAYGGIASRASSVRSAGSSRTSSSRSAGSIKFRRASRFSQH